MQADVGSGEVMGSGIEEEEPTTYVTIASTCGIVIEYIYEQIHVNILFGYSFYYMCIHVFQLCEVYICSPH